MRCGEAKNWLSLAHDKCLPPDRTLPLERHLEGCSECRAYREDLRLGSRMLQATEPHLSDSFDWRLGLRLNQRLAEAAGSVPAPWERVRAATWWGRFGAGTAAGAIAAAALGIWVLPAGRPVMPIPVSAGPALVEQTVSQDRLPLQTEQAVALDRLPLQPTTRGAGGAATVNYGNRDPFRRAGVVSWSGSNLGDGQLIVSLRQDNQRLRAALVHAQREIDALKAKRQREAAAELGTAFAPESALPDAPAEAVPSGATDQQ